MPTTNRKTPARCQTCKKFVSKLGCKRCGTQAQEPHVADGSTPDWFVLSTDAHRIVGEPEASAPELTREVGPARLAPTAPSRFPNWRRVVESATMAAGFVAFLGWAAHHAGLI